MIGVNHSDVVRQLHASHPPAKTGPGALAFVLRVIAELQRQFPDERVGLLVKTAGENIEPYAGTSVSAGRIVYPDFDLLVKVLTDIPTTNGPSWQTEEGIPNKGHHGGYLAVSPIDESAPPPPPPADPPADPDQQGTIDALARGQITILQLYAVLAARVASVEQQLVNLEIANADTNIHVKWLEEGRTGYGTGTVVRAIGRDLHGERPEDA